MYANQGWSRRVQLSLNQSDDLFSRALHSKSHDSEATELGWQVRFCYAVYLWWAVSGGAVLAAHIALRFHVTCLKAILVSADGSVK